MQKVFKEIRGILLDLDGTIVDSREAYLEAAKTAYEKIDYKIPDFQIIMEIPKRLEQRLPIESIPAADLERFLKSYLNKFYSITKKKSRPFHNVDNTLRNLSLKAKLALITMRFTPKRVVALEMEQFGLAQYFTSIVTALDTPNPKPSPEALIVAAKHLGVSLRRCIVVGDSISDVRAGKSAGIATVSVLSGLFSRQELEYEKPDLILGTINELPQHIDFSQ